MIGGWWHYYDIIIRNNCFNLAFLDRVNRFYSEENQAPTDQLTKYFISLGSKITSVITWWHSMFLVFSQKIPIVEIPLNAFLGDIGEVVLLK